MDVYIPSKTKVTLENIAFDEKKNLFGNFNSGNFNAFSYWKV